jgi:hypothetical protein
MFWCYPGAFPAYDSRHAMQSHTKYVLSYVVLVKEVSCFLCLLDSKSRFDIFVFVHIYTWLKAVHSINTLI